ncbi:hypothetical protein [Variovorax sp. OV329]|uniref:hypothetical protein n=1 Tax=Variovorax sp. OV329 TaxID=1882825 RepID=UPI0015870365|nr:hypothetical protein [Variovorax sp. OV329]
MELVDASFFMRRLGSAAGLPRARRASTRLLPVTVLRPSRLALRGSLASWGLRAQPHLVDADHFSAAAATSPSHAAQCAACELGHLHRQASLSALQFDVDLGLGAGAGRGATIDHRSNLGVGRGSSTGTKRSVGGDVDVAGLVDSTCARGVTARGVDKPARFKPLPLSHL